MIRKEVAKEIQEAVKNRGNLPGGWKMWADDELGVPKYNWKSELRKVLSRSMHTVPGDSLRSYRRLSRRSAAMGHRVILPSHHNSTPHAAIIQDTSGSMGSDAYVSSMEETKGFLKAIQTPITWINCDAAADKGQTVHTISNIDLYGGGGTDMRVGIKAALDLRPMPDVIILFTDGYTPWPEEPMPRGVQLIVCLVGHAACKVNEVPDFCKVVKIVDDLVEVG
jgi:predicted metal-dependent peptidase